MRGKAKTERNKRSVKQGKYDEREHQDEQERNLGKKETGGEEK